MNKSTEDILEQELVSKKPKTCSFTTLLIWIEFMVICALIGVIIFLITSGQRPTTEKQSTTTKSVQCGTRPWENVESYEKTDKYSNSDKYLWNKGVGRIVGGVNAKFGEWPWQVSLGTKNYSGYCNGIELKLEDVGNASSLDMRMFGRYDLTSQIIDNREVYLSENHLYTIWYSDIVTSWILSRKNENSQIDIIYFDLDQNWDTYAKETFASNAYGDHLWNVVGQSWLQINVSVNCTSTMDWNHMCGGSILNENWIITAAHCILPEITRVEIDSLYARIGEYNMAVEDEPLNYVERKVKLSVIHPEFLSSFHFDNPRCDIGLLQLDKPIKFQANMMPICLPQDDNNFEGKFALVTGWGKLEHGLSTRPMILRGVLVKIYDNDYCQSMVLNNGFQENVTESTSICSMDVNLNGGKSPCHGDSGGPLMVKGNDDRYVLAGIVSWGHHCGGKKYPAFYTRVSEFRDWIDSYINEDSFQNESFIMNSSEYPTFEDPDF